MKKTFIALFFCVPLFFCSCIKKEAPVKMSINYEEARENFSKEFKVEPMDSSVVIGKDLVVIAPQEEGLTYTLSGYFKGQIVSSTKNTTIRLNNVFIENSEGKAALKCDAKTEVSSVKETENYIVSYGRGNSKNAALMSRRSLVLGGSGKIYISGSVWHGIEADDVKLKGTGSFIVSGTNKGSALKCEMLTVEPEKKFNAYFINSKNGIKADSKISISSGNFYLYNNETAMKTNTEKDDPNRAHSIKLLGGTFYTHENKKIISTQKDAYFLDNADFVEE